jgi:RNA polymerase sigma factor (sigma-70 family)
MSAGESRSKLRAVPRGGGHAGAGEEKATGRPSQVSAASASLEEHIVALRLRSLEGDLDAARDLVLSFSPYARAVLHNCRLTAPEIEDCSQELWGKLFDSEMKALRAWRGDGHLRAYLATIVRRLALDTCRRRELFGTVSSESLPEGQAPGEQGGDGEIGLLVADPQVAAERAEGRRLLKRGLATLSPRYRQVLVLRYFLDRKHREIGESMSMPTSQVGIVLQRAERALAKALAELGADS